MGNKDKPIVGRNGWTTINLLEKQVKLNEERRKINSSPAKCWFNEAESLIPDWLEKGTMSSLKKTEWVLPYCAPFKYYVGKGKKWKDAKVAHK